MIYIGIQHKRIDLTGNKYGRLTVIRYAYTKNNRAYWECKCDCGNPEIFIAMGKTLKNGGTKSCGCLTKELMKKIKPQISKNNYIIYSNNIMIEVIDENDNKYYSLINSEDYELSKKYLWWISGSGYLISQNQDEIIFLHKLILYGDDYNTKLEGDHIDGDKLNNRRYNLRKVTHQLNSYNNKKYKNNNSNITGVWFDKRSNKWCAEINYKKKKYWLGSYINKEEAIFIREIAELKLFKQYSRRYNELKEKYKNVNIDDIDI